MISGKLSLDKARFPTSVYKSMLAEQLFPHDRTHTSPSQILESNDRNRSKYHTARSVTEAEEYSRLPAYLKEIAIHTGVFIMSVPTSKGPEQLLDLSAKVDSLAHGDIVANYDSFRRDLIEDLSLSRRDKEAELRNFLRLVLARDLGRLMALSVSTKMEKDGAQVDQADLGSMKKLTQIIVGRLIPQRKSEESRKKISKSLRKKYKQDPEMRERVRRSNSKRPKTEEMRDNMNIAVANAYETNPEIRLKVSKSAKKRRYDEVARAKRREGMRRAMERDPSIIERLALYHGRPHSEETKLKISQSRRRFEERKRAKV